MSASADTEREVRRRARERCQYCRMHQSLQGATFHVEHVIPRSLGGQAELSNLVLACPGCNLHKSNRVEAVDPNSGRTVRLYHPLTEKWDEHFLFDGFMIVGRTETGRATVEALRFNHPRRIKIREAEALFGLLPPG